MHLDGAYNVTRPAFVKMRENGFGRIIVTTSAAGLYGNFGQTNYSAAKMGLIGFMNTLKLEGEKYNIKINAVAPMAATRLTEDVLPSDLFEKIKPEFVAPLVLYLCSDTCAETGMIFNAGMGIFNRAAVVPDRERWSATGRPTHAEQIHQQWDAINNLTTPRNTYNATGAVGSMLEAFTPKESKSDTRWRLNCQSGVRSDRDRLFSLKRQRE